MLTTAPTNDDLATALRRLQRYDMTYNDPGCDCCGPSVEEEACAYGGWVRWADVSACLNRTPPTTPLDSAPTTGDTPC